MSSRRDNGSRHWQWLAAAGAAIIVLILAVPVAVGGEWPAFIARQADGDTLMDQMGTSVAIAGELDQDGYDDYIVGAPSGLDPHLPVWIGAGFARVFSSYGDSVIYEKTGSTDGDLFGYSVAGGADITGDDPFYLEDFVVGAPGADPGALDSAGSVYVYSGEDGSLAYQLDGIAAGDAFGWSVAIASRGWGGPGWDNSLVVGAPGADTGSFSNNGAVYLFDYTGSSIATLYGQGDGDEFGHAVANVGYSNGSPMFVVGVPDADPSGLTNAGSAYVYRYDGLPLFQVNGGAVGDAFGWAVGSAGDVNLDGDADFIVGAPYTDAGGVSYSGAAYVYSGDDGSLLLQIDGTRQSELLGISVGSTGDVNGDGWPDVMVGSQMGSGLTAPALIYSGVDGSPIFYLPSGGLVAYSVAGNLYTNADNRADFLVGNPYTCGTCPQGGDPESHTQAGSAYLFRSGYGETIQSITDVGNDQGKQVRIEWQSLPTDDNFVKELAIYRRVEDGLKRSADPYNLSGTPPGTWDFVLSVPARGDSFYSAVVPTLADSTASEGTVWSAFFVSALGENPIDHFDSPVDSGYSVDNLAPSPPPSLMAELAGSDVALDWEPVDDADFDYYWVYRDIVADFTIDDSKRIGSTSDTSFLDTSVPGETPYYKVSAVDFAGNESDPSNEVSVSSCVCPYQSDFDEDGFLTSLDLSEMIDILFAGHTDVQDSSCPSPRADFDCDGYSTSLDLSGLIDHLFVSGPGPCDPCQ